MIRAITLFLATLVVSATTALAASWQPLVSPDGLAKLIPQQEEAVILDIRAPDAYAQGHVAGAVNVPYPAWRGPEANPGALIDDQKLTLLLSEAGITPEAPVIITYSGSNTTDFGSAARVYWTLKSAGVAQIAILNGGLAAWTAAGKALSTAEDSNFPSDNAFTFAETWRIDRDGVRAVLEGRRSAQLIDARPEAFFIGVKKHKAAAWAGTFTGALNIVHENWFGGPVLSADAASVLAMLRAKGIEPDGADIVSFCNTGHWAATNWFVLSEIAGIEGVKLYPESLVGWTRSAERTAAITQ